jgi:hypothetical protein
MRLHNRQYENFIAASGFGVGRMVRPPRLEWIERAPLRNIAFANHKKTAVENWRSAWDPLRTDIVDPNGLHEFHHISRADFLHPDGFGAVFEPLISIAGFIPHAFHDPPAAALKDPTAWTVERLELVSLLKFNEPRVYVLDHLPRMDQLAGDDVPTRALDEFESAALPRLRTAEDVVIDESAGSTRMLGSLRAASQCLDCHSVQRGELLGAFTYFLHPGRAAEPLSESAAGQ